MTLHKKDIDYFNKGTVGIEKFWKRLFGKPDFTDSFVIDVGCGHGRLCIDIALSGAKKVVGIDINSRLIEFARENLHINYPNLLNKVIFEDIDLTYYDKRKQFDYIVSKDSFEHIIDLHIFLSEMKKRLKKGGSIYIGFGPLYNSYYGDHRRTKAIIPWGHLIIPELLLLKRVSKKRGKKINSIQELGLNKMSLKEYKKLFKESSLSIVYFKVNCSDHPISKLFTFISKFPKIGRVFFA